MCHFRPLEVMGFGSEAQLQVSEYLNYITWFKQNTQTKDRKKCLKQSFYIITEQLLWNGEELSGRTYGQLH